MARGSLLIWLELGDVLIVRKPDRLDHNVMDVPALVEKLKSAGVRMHCLALSIVNLTSLAQSAR